jgi:hypothetical protein
MVTVDLTRAPIRLTLDESGPQPDVELIQTAGLAYWCPETLALHHPIGLWPAGRFRLIGADGCPSTMGLARLAHLYGRGAGRTRAP